MEVVDWDEDAVSPSPWATAPHLVALPTTRRTNWSAVDLMEAEFPPPRWAVPGLLPEGANLLAGAPKLGKSWMALGLSVAIASGGVALGKEPVEQGEVLYLALEDTPRRLQTRLGQVLGDGLAPAGLTFWTECEALPAGGTDRIAAWCGEHPDRRAVFVDVFTKVRGSAAKNVPPYDADYAAMGLLKAIADEYAVCVTAVHHTRKAADDDSLNTVSGTQGIAGAADGVLVLTRSRGASDAILKVTGRDIEEADHALRFDAHTGSWSLLEGLSSDWDLPDSRRRVVQLIRDEPSLTPKEVAQRLELTHDNARQLLTRMNKAGQIDTDGQGHYFTPVTPVTAVTDPDPLRDRGDTCDRSGPDHG